MESWSDNLKPIWMGTNCLDFLLNVPLFDPNDQFDLPFLSMSALFQHLPAAIAASIVFLTDQSTGPGTAFIV